MFASSFPEANVVLGAPDDISVEDCEPLNVARLQLEGGQTVVVSCWKVTAEELAEIQRTGRVWLMVWGVTMPPVALCGVKPIEAQNGN